MPPHQLYRSQGSFQTRKLKIDLCSRQWETNLAEYVSYRKFWELSRLYQERPLFSLIVFTLSVHNPPILPPTQTVNVLTVVQVRVYIMDKLWDKIVLFFYPPVKYFNTQQMFVHFWWHNNIIITSWYEIKIG